MLAYKYLNKDQLNELHNHLRKCETCSDIFKKMMQLEDFIEEQKKLNLSKDFSSRIMEQISSNPIRTIQPAWQIQTKRLLAAASITAIIWMGYKAGSFYNATTDSPNIEQEFAYINDVALESIDSWIME